MEVLKIATGGSVDDGKSTLIGRLLYDTNSLTEDKLAYIEETSKKQGYDYLDFSLATDGLIAEREQGITIDIAHIYFSTDKRSYIIADAPGHVEYTRNMVTGASTSQSSIILIDVRKGVTEQTKRHFFINNLLKIRNIIVVINKMDLVDYDEQQFEQIKANFNELAATIKADGQKINFIPVSALYGDNVVIKSEKTPWYQGMSLLNHLENLEVSDLYLTGKARYPVQYVVRPKTEAFHDFRGYAGKLYGGALEEGDAVVVYPSLAKSSIKDIYFYDQKSTVAKRGNSLTLTLADDLDLSRGDMIVKEGEEPIISKKITATICWLSAQELDKGKVYKLQHRIQKVMLKVDTVLEKVNDTFSGYEKENMATVKMNDIARVSLTLNKPIYYDTFEDNRENGSFILIDKQTKNTVAVGFIEV